MEEEVLELRRSGWGELWVRGDGEGGLGAEEGGSASLTTTVLATEEGDAGVELGESGGGEGLGGTGGGGRGEEGRRGWVVGSSSSSESEGLSSSEESMRAGRRSSGSMERGGLVVLEGGVGDLGVWGRERGGALGEVLLARFLACL